MNAIRIEGLQKSFGRVQALAGLDLTVEEGAVFGFLGPNGAGKTTTIRILAGLARPNRGRAWVAGQEVTADHRRVAARIGYLPEEPACYPWMTPREFLDHVGRVFGLSAQEREERIKELLDLVGLAEVSKRRVGGFSRGMRQRLGLAQALVNRPQVLLLDEPVSALDPSGRKEILEMIAGLRGRCTVFMSTHILADVERVCDTVGIINLGRLIISGRQEDLVARYAQPVFELEGEPGASSQIEAWAEALRREPWVAAISVDGATARVAVRDVEVAKRELMATAVRAELALTRYQMLKPSLEDVFMRLVGEGRQVA